MKRTLLVLLASAITLLADDVIVETVPLVKSSAFEVAAATAVIQERLSSGVYDGYSVDLCVDNPASCGTPEFEPYKQVKDGKTTYSIRLEKGMWSNLPKVVQDAVTSRLVSSAWKDEKSEWFPVEVKLKGKEGVSPLDQLSPHARSRYLKFALPDSLKGGKGQNAYGPNCWYTSIAAIADKGAAYAKKAGLAEADWDKARFMGPTEFRYFIQEMFEEVATPQFGDIVRYYTENEIYAGIVFGGEIHAAVYVGREITTDKYGDTKSRDVVLTKNGRSDLDFLLFQHVESLDKIYLSPLKEGDPLLKGGQDLRRKGYFRARKGARIFDPAYLSTSADSCAAYLVDELNYRDRWACLAGRINPPPGSNTSAYSYPPQWITLSRTK